MSRAAAAQSSSTATPDTFLVLRDNPDGSSFALLRSQPFGNNGHPVDIGALIILIGLLNYSHEERIANRKNYLDCEQSRRKKKFCDYAAFTSHGSGIFKIKAYPVWIHILSFLLYDNAFQTVPVISPQHFPSINNQLNDLQSRALQTVQSAALNFNFSFFSKDYKACFEFATLLDAALNADQIIVEKILRGTNPKQLKIFLSTPGNATISHLGFVRTGTPLQMALYSHDEKMVEVIKRHMDPIEFQHQCEAVFGPDYNAFLKKQRDDAIQLCNELRNTFTQALEFEINDALQNIINTNPALQNTLNRSLNQFKSMLEQYVRENPVHNPYITRCLLEIYTLSWGGWNKECLLSWQIGLAEKLSSAVWLQHYARGIYYLINPRVTMLPTCNFLTQNSPALDIRTLDRLGVDDCISIFGDASAKTMRGGIMTRRGARLGVITPVEQLACFKELVTRKTNCIASAINPTYSVTAT